MYLCLRKIIWCFIRYKGEKHIKQLSTMNKLVKTIGTLLVCTLFMATSVAYGQLNPSMDFTKAAQSAVYTVVHIQCQYTQQTNFYDDFFSGGFFSQMFPMQPQSRQVRTSGSGVIFSSDGYIVTNNHVVQDADSIQVVLNDNRSFNAKIIGTDPQADIAVIKIDTKNLPFIEFGNSDSTQIGQWVLAVGNPFNLTSTVTAGIISAKARNLNILGTNMASNPLEFFIQTDAAVNPGNSGGALVDLSGKLIGINTAIASNTGAYTGYSFATPSNIVKKIANDLKLYGLTQKVSLGISINAVDSELAKQKALKSVQGLYVASIQEGSSAQKAGLKEGDVILSVNGKATNSNSELQEILAQSSPKDILNMQIERGASQIEKQVTLLNENGTTSIVKAQSEQESTKNTFDVLGAKVRELSAQEKKDYSLQSGFVIESIAKSSFASLGVKKGFIITSIDGKNNITTQDLQLLNRRKGQLLFGGIYPRNKNAFYSYMMIL